MLARAGLLPEEGVEAAAFGGTVGLGILAMLILALGWVGWINGPALAALMLASALLSGGELARFPDILQALPSRLRGMRRPSPWLLGALGVTGLAALFLLTFGVAPPTDWDTLMYHLQVPARFLEEGRIYLPPDNLHVTVAGLMHMLYLPLLAAGSPTSPALLNGFLAVLLALMVLRAGTRWFGGDAGGLGLLLFWGSTAILLVAATARTDVTLALYLFLGHYSLLRGLEAAGGMGGVQGSGEGGGPSPKPPEGLGPISWTLLAAVLLGMGVGIKFNALAYAAVLAPLALRVLLEAEGWGRGMARSVLLCALVGGAFMAPWLLKNLFLVGAPFYPFFAERLASPWLNSLFPGGSAVAVVGPEITRSLRLVQEGYTLWAPFFDPGRLNVEVEGAFYFTNRAFLLLPLAFFFRPRALAGWLILPALLFVALTVALTVPNLRYLIPAAPALTVALAGVLHGLRKKWAPGWAGAVGLLGVGVLALLPTVGTVATWLGRTPALAHAVGAASAEEYHAGHLDPGVRFYRPVVRHVNETLSPDDRLLLLWEARGFPLEPRVIQDNKISNWPVMAEALEMHSGCLNQVGEFEYVLLASAAANYYRFRGLGEDRIRWEAFQRYRDRCLSELWSSPGFTLFRVRESVSGPDPAPAP